MWFLWCPAGRESCAHLALDDLELRKITVELNRERFEDLIMRSVRPPVSPLNVEQEAREPVVELHWEGDLFNSLNS